MSLQNQFSNPFRHLATYLLPAAIMGVTTLSNNNNTEEREQLVSNLAHNLHREMSPYNRHMSFRYDTYFSAELFNHPNPNTIVIPPDMPKYSKPFEQLSAEHQSFYTNLATEMVNRLYQSGRVDRLPYPDALSVGEIDFDLRALKQLCQLRSSSSDPHLRSQYEHLSRLIRLIPSVSRWRNSPYIELYNRLGLEPMTMNASVGSHFAAFPADPSYGFPEGLAPTSEDIQNVSELMRLGWGNARELLTAEITQERRNRVIPTILRLARSENVTAQAFIRNFDLRHLEGWPRTPVADEILVYRALHLGDNSARAVLNGIHSPWRTDSPRTALEKLHFGTDAERTQASEELRNMLSNLTPEEMAYLAREAPAYAPLAPVETSNAEGLRLNAEASPPARPTSIETARSAREAVLERRVGLLEESLRALTDGMHHILEEIRRGRR